MNNKTKEVLDNLGVNLADFYVEDLSKMTKHTIGSIVSVTRSLGITLKEKQFDSHGNHIVGT